MIDWFHWKVSTKSWVHPLCFNNTPSILVFRYIVMVHSVKCQDCCVFSYMYNIAFVFDMKRSFTLSLSVMFVMAHFVLFVHVFSILFWSVLVFSHVLFVMRHELCFCLERNLIYLSLMFLLRLIRCLNGLMFLFGLC